MAATQVPISGWMGKRVVVCALGGIMFILKKDILSLGSIWMHWEVTMLRGQGTETQHYTLSFKRGLKKLNVKVERIVVARGWVWCIRKVGS